MSKYSSMNEKLFRDMTTADLRNALVYLYLELERVESELVLLRGQIQVAEEVLKKRGEDCPDRLDGS